MSAAFLAMVLEDAPAPAPRRLRRGRREPGAIGFKALAAHIAVICVPRARGLTADGAGSAVPAGGESSTVAMLAEAGPGSARVSPGSAGSCGAGTGSGRARTGRDIGRLVGFYEKATVVQATGSTEDFAEIQATRATLAIGSTRAVPLLAPGAARPASEHTVIIEFLVDDVDGVHQDLAGFVGDFAAEPTTLPWGNRSLLLRDPMAISSASSPLTPAAIGKFAR